MRELPEPDLTLQLLILAGAFGMALLACMWVEWRIGRRYASLLEDQEQDR